MVSSLRTIQTLILAATLVVGCKSMQSQQATTQQPTNPFDAAIIPPPATGSYTASNNYTPPPGAAAFAPINTNTTQPAAVNSAPTTSLPTTSPAATYGSLPLTRGTTTTTTSSSTLPANVLGQSLDQGAPLPVTSRAGTAQQGVASRLHDSSNAVSSSTQTTTVGK